MSPNLYVTIDTLKGGGAFNLEGTAYESRLLSLTNGVSRQIDRWCNRHFYYLIETRTFSGYGGTRLLVSDLISLSSVKEDTNVDGTFETTWATADYLLAPFNANPTAEWGRAYSWIDVNESSNGTQDEWLKGQRNYELAGTWGYWKVTRDTGENGTGTLTSTGTVLTLTASSTLELGQMIVLDSEIMFINGRSGTDGTAFTVERAINGSTATAHPTADVFTIIFPQPVTEACFIQAGRLWKRKDSAFMNLVGIGEIGQLTVSKMGLDQDVKDLLMPYRKLAV